MLLSLSRGKNRKPRRSAIAVKHLTAPRPAIALAPIATHKPAVSFIVLILLVSQVGCAALGRSGAAEQVAASRDLARQGIAAMESGHWQRAEELLNQAVEASPEDSDPHRYLAEVLWQRGQTQRARSHIEGAIQLDPSNGAITVRAGEMALAAGAHEEALARGDDAIRLDPKVAAAWALRGRAFWRLNQPDRAAADLQRALELQPQCPDVLLDLALIYRQQGEPARALATLHSLLDAYPPGQEPQLAWVLEGQALMAMGRHHQAADSFLVATRRGPPSAEICFLLAEAQSRAGEHAAATAAAEQALAIDTSHAASRQLLAQLAASPPGTPSQPR